jgi:4-diphosphocytidyl-2-C-methyl-D-erythritol kinase
MAGPATEAAPAKVNLTLHITGRRPDGYHLLDSLVVFASVADRVHARPAAALSLAITGPFKDGLADDPDNLVLRAARLLAERGDRPSHAIQGAALTLEKHLPVASGIGGGSADAAATLRLLARLWQIPPASPDLARQLGADVPVCLLGRAVRMHGIGEELDPVPPLPRCGLLLVNPGVPLATAAVFRARRGAFSTAAALPRAWPDATGLAAWLQEGGNDLQAAALALCPDIADVLAAIAAQPDCLLARMSGSGATCFGLFRDPATAAAGAAVLRGRSGWWCWGGALAG